MTNVQDDRIGLIITDFHDRVIDVDDAYLKIVGRSRGDLLGRHALSFTHDDDLSRNQPLLDGLTRSGHGFAITKRYVRGDGSLVWVHNHVSRIKRASGDHHVSVTCRPIGSPIDAGVKRNHALVRRFCAVLDAMKAELTADIVSSPAAEALLCLYRSELEGRSMRVDEVARAVGNAPSVMIRWARLLQERDLIEIDGDEPLGSATTVRISGRGERALDRLFSGVGS
ncbi:MAG: PAS domain S-box protein [Sphingomonas sp.]|nr:MAG: PAS domain S-box protein [Sphingomonas sp.]